MNETRAYLLLVLPVVTLLFGACLSNPEPFQATQQNDLSAQTTETALKAQKNLELFQPVSTSRSTYSAYDKDERSPNIVIIIADDLGWNDVGFHNSKLYTPNIDWIANEGLKLERFYVSPICTPTRAALLSGKYPGRMGLNKGVIRPNRNVGLPPEVTTLPEILATAGYNRRACIGKWHLGHSNVKYHPMNNGFTEFYGHYGGMVNYFTHTRRSQLDWHRNFESSYDEGYTTDLIATESVRFIESCKEEIGKEGKEQDPFFLYVAFNAPHSPLQAKENDLKNVGYNDKEPIFLENGEKLSEYSPFYQGRGNNKRQTYCAMLSSMDQNIGRILKSLEAQGFMHNTIVLFMSDNGGVYTQGGSNAPLRGGKGQVYEGGVRAAAAVMWQNGGWVGGKSINDVLGHIDIVPTIQALVTKNKRAKNSNIDGVNALDILNQKKSGDKDREFYLGRAGYLAGNWKYAHDGLFDMDTDQNELRDVSNEHPKIVEKMKKRLIKLREEIEMKIDDPEDFPVQKEWRMPE